MRTLRSFSIFAVIVAISVGLIACGGGGSKPAPVQPPATITISTSTLANGTEGVAYNATVSSDCTGVCSWTVSSGALPEGLTMAAASGSSASATITGTPTKAGTFNFSVRVANASTFATKNLAITVTAQNITISTQTMPNGIVGMAYSADIMSNCAGTCLWTISGGTLPHGLGICYGGAYATICGTPFNIGTFTFTAQVANGDHSAQKEFTIRIDDHPPVVGRNDSIATATPLSTGTYRASISPYADANGQASPDTDYYVLTAKAGSTVQIDVAAVNLGTTLDPVELMDPVIEIVDANGVRFRTCQDPGDDGATAPLVADKTPTAWDDECMNDDRGVDNTGVYSTNSRLYFQPAGAAGTNQTFYVHVIEWRGDARPDIVYNITVAGVN